MDLFLKEYLSSLQLERNLSENTISSYKNDIRTFIGFLSSRNINDRDEITFQQINSFFSSLSDLGLSDTSSARYNSSLKGFFKYLFLNSYIRVNPMDRVASPKIHKSLPVVLNVSEIQKILDAPDINKKLGIRDKAILEMFYACGLRVSELLNIKLSDLFFDQEM